MLRFEVKSLKAFFTSAFSVIILMVCLLCYPKRRKSCSPIMFLLTVNFQASAILTALFLAFGLVQDLLMMLL